MYTYIYTLYEICRTPENLRSNDTSSTMKYTHEIRFSANIGEHSATFEKLSLQNTSLPNTWFYSHRLPQEID